MDAMFDVMAVVPLIAGQVVEADKWASDPSLCWFLAPQRVCGGAAGLGAIA